MRRSNILLSLFIAVIVMAFSSLQHAHASGEIIDFESINVLDDLTKSNVNGVAFDLSHYPYDSEGDLRVINFVEYCYSYKPDKRMNFGLYVYVYNPQALPIYVESQSNKIQLAVRYDGEGNPDSYEKFGLKFCSKSESEYKDLFYKFKIIDRKSAFGQAIVERVDLDARRYDVSGIELHESGKTNAEEYSVNKTYIFSGYAQGLGADGSATSTLACEAQELEIIKLNVRNTFYRTGLSDKGKGHQNQLDSVYFSVDNKIIEYYGKLQRVKAEWYEYKTQPIIITSNLELYNNALRYLGKQISYNSFNEEIGYALFCDLYESAMGDRVSSWGWNGGNYAYATEICETLYYLFKVNNIKANNSGEKVVGNISNAELEKHIREYSETHAKGYLPLKYGAISADLFDDGVDEGRTKAYNCQEFDADIYTHEMLSYNAGGFGFWDKARDFGFWNSLFNQSNLPDLDNRYEKMTPIYPVGKTDLSGSDFYISERLLINENDVSDFKDYFAEAERSNKTVFLFRFAVTDYMAKPLTIFKPDKFLIFDISKCIEGQAYLAQETVFLDFDIIELTFYNDGVYHVIPVVSSPIDIINELTPPVWFPIGNGCQSGLSSAIRFALLVCLAIGLLKLMFSIIDKMKRGNKR